MLWRRIITLAKGQSATAALAGGEQRHSVESATTLALRFVITHRWISRDTHSISSAISAAPSDGFTSPAAAPLAVAPAAAPAASAPAAAPAAVVPAAAASYAASVGLPPLSVRPEASTTCTRASAVHRSARNWLPLPLPWYAPGTRPATSTIVQGSSRRPSAARPCAVGVWPATSAEGSACAGAAYLRARQGVPCAQSGAARDWLKCLRSNPKKTMGGSARRGAHLASPTLGWMVVKGAAPTLATTAPPPTLFS